MKKARRVLGAATAAAAVVLAYCAAGAWAPAPEPAVPGPTDGARLLPWQQTPAPVQTPGAPAPRHASRTAAPADVASGGGGAPPPDWGARVEGLLRAGSPEDLRLAFALLHRCATVDELRDIAHAQTRSDEDKAGFARYLRWHAETRQRCENVPQALIAQRHRFLDQAIAGGNGTAAIDFLSAGPPQGLQSLEPDDPAFLPWRTVAVEQLERFAVRGHLEAAATLARLAMSSKFPELQSQGRGWAYVLLFEAVDRQHAAATDPPETARRHIASTERHVAAVAAMLTPEERALGRARFQALIAQRTEE